MEIQPLTLETIFNLLRERAAQSQIPLIVDARIAVSPQEARLLAIRPERPLETIRY